MSVADQIKAGRKARGWSQARLAKELGVSRTAIIQWENPDTTPKLRSHHILELSRLLNKPTSAFSRFGGDTTRTTAEVGRHAIPLLNWKDLPSLGPGHVMLKALKKPAYLEVSKEISKKAIALTINDESMAPEFAVGEEIVVDPNVRPVGENDCVLVRMGNGEHLFRRYRPRGNRGAGEVVAYDLVPENANWKTVSVLPEDGKVEILGTLVEHRRRRRAQ